MTESGVGRRGTRLMSSLFLRMKSDVAILSLGGFSS